MEGFRADGGYVLHEQRSFVGGGISFVDPVMSNAAIGSCIRKNSLSSPGSTGRRNDNRRGRPHPHQISNGSPTLAHLGAVFADDGKVNTPSQPASYNSCTSGWGEILLSADDVRNCSGGRRNVAKL